MPYYGYYNYYTELPTGYSIVSLLIIAAVVVAMWFIFQKAGEPGWAAIVPFYNLYVLYKITWGSGWFFLIMFIPFANFVIHILTMVKLSKVFGKGGGWACGLIFLYPIFLCITGFSQDIQYVGQYGAASAGGYSSNPYGQTGYQNPYQQQGSQSNPQYTYARPEQPPMKKFCPYCGAAMDGNAKFCPKCGQQQ